MKAGQLTALHEKPMVILIDGDALIGECSIDEKTTGKREMIVEQSPT